MLLTGPPPSACPANHVSKNQGLNSETLLSKLLTMSDEKFVECEVACSCTYGSTWKFGDRYAAFNMPCIPTAQNPKYECYDILTIFTIIL